MVEDINYSYIKWIYKSGRWNLEYNIHNNRIICKTFKVFLMDTKRETVYPITKTLLCPRCRQIGKHTLYVTEYSIYKCTICGNIHA